MLYYRYSFFCSYYQGGRRALRKISHHPYIFCRLISFLFCLFLLVSFASCSNDTVINDAPEEKCFGNATLAISVEKTLTGAVNSNIKYWEFMATPLFSLAPGEGPESGRVEYWRQLGAITTLDDGVLKLGTSLGRYMQGEWFFELRALNKRGHVIAIGSTRAYITKLKDNVVSITVLHDSADGTHGESKDDTSRVTGVTSKDFGLSTTKRYGTVKSGFTINRLEYDTNAMRVTVASQKLDRNNNTVGENESISSTWNVVEEGAMLPLWYTTETSSINNTGVIPSGNSTTAVEEGKVFYSNEFSLDAGHYIISYNVEVLNSSKEWKIIGSQSLLVHVVGGEYSIVKGSILPNTYSLVGIRVTVPGTIYGSINNNSAYCICTDSDTALLKWTQSDIEKENSGEIPTSFVWYVDGVKQEEMSSSITVKCPRDEKGNRIYGVYRISVSPKGSAGSWGFTDFDLIFRP